MIRNTSSLNIAHKSVCVHIAFKTVRLRRRACGATLGAHLMLTLVFSSLSHSGPRTELWRDAPAVTAVALLPLPLPLCVPFAAYLNAPARTPRSSPGHLPRA